MTSRYPRGVFTLSLDFELVWGSRDLYDDPAPLLEQARITRQRVFEPLLRLLEEHAICATWATVGLLFRGSGATAPARPFAGLTPPRHRWRPDWFAGLPEGGEDQNPEFYGRSLVERLRASHQEIGSHSFSHPVFGDEGCSAEAADSDLAHAVAAATEMGITLRSFVFPRNVSGHLGLLAKHGFTNWRGLEPRWYRSDRVPGPISRVAHLAEVVAAATPPTVMPYRDEFGLWVIPASSSLLPVDGVRRLIPIRNRFRRVIAGIDRAAADGRVSHLYTHPINLAGAPEALLAGFREVFGHAARLRDRGQLDILSMGALAERNTAMNQA